MPKPLNDVVLRTFQVITALGDEATFIKNSRWAAEFQPSPRPLPSAPPTPLRPWNHVRPERWGPYWPMAGRERPPMTSNRRQASRLCRTQRLAVTSEMLELELEAS